MIGRLYKANTCLSNFLFIPQKKLTMAYLSPSVDRDRRPYRALNGSAPAYLSSYFTRVADVPSRSRLRSSASEQLIVPSFNLTTVGRRAFPVSAANLWNSLRAHLTSAPSLTIFRQRLKSFLSRRSYPDIFLTLLL